MITGKPVIEEELQLVFPGGRTVHLLASAAPLFDERGNVQGAVVAGTDITPAKKVEENLREEYRRLSLHIDNSPLAIVECNRDFHITRWAGTAERVFGWVAEEMMGKRIDELPWIHPEDVPLVEQVMADMISGKRPSNVNPNRNVRKDGALIHCEWYNSSIRDASGLISVLSEVLDVTDRKRAEEATRESQAQFRTLADSIPQLAWMADETGSIYWYNQRWYEYTGTTLDQVQFKDADGRESTTRRTWNVVPHFRRCFEAGIVWEDTFPLLGKDGQYRWFLSRAVPVRDSAGRIVRWFGRNTDVTGQRETEQALRASQGHLRRLYEANIIGIISADSERIFGANDVFLRMVGYSRDDLESGGLRQAEFTPPEYLDADQTAITEILTTGSCKPFEKAYLRKDGGVVPVLMGAALIERHPPEWVGFVVDLTERKALERKLQAKQKLESIGLLAGGVAHDFNNLLVGILGNASLAQEFAAPGSALAQMWTTSWGRASAPPT